MRLRTAATLLPCLALASASARAEEAKPARVEKGRQVAIEYTLRLEDGTTLESASAGEPLVFEQGAQEILPALEEALDGMKVGESRRVTVPPEKGFGPARPELVQEVEIELIPEMSRVAGAYLSAEDESGNRHPVRVHEVRGDKVLIDTNHPLAGRTLVYDVKVLAVE